MDHLWPLDVGLPVALLREKVVVGPDITLVVCLAGPVHVSRTGRTSGSLLCYWHTLLMLFRHVLASGHVLACCCLHGAMLLTQLAWACWEHHAVIVLCCTGVHYNICCCRPAAHQLQTDAPHLILVRCSEYISIECTHCFELLVRGPGLLCCAARDCVIRVS